MKTAHQLYEIIKAHPFHTVNAHIHTHLCDGHEDMTVENIATAAKEAGLSLIILVPHFHKQVSDQTATLYTDSEEQIFEQLREEIDFYKQKNETVEILLSTEADILSIDGTISLHPSSAIEKNLDLVTPTLNYHPLLPLSAVAVTHTKEVDAFHTSGIYDIMAQQAGGKTYILETAYQAMTNAIRHSDYPSMLGHFFASHTIPGDAYTWFGITENDRSLIYSETKKLLEACKKKDAFLDISGIHCKNRSVTEQRHKDGFLHTFQQDTLALCKNLDILFCAGSDAHSLRSIKTVNIYQELF